MLAAPDKITILIVEDDAPVAMMMVFLLTRAGCETEVVTTGKRAMEIAQEKKFSLITLDTDLPDITGFEICRELKQRHFSRHTPVVFVSTRATIENQQRALELGAADFIEKPFDTQDFLSRILSLVEETATV
jgi:DNA-binding response OmpR family regulator